MSSRHCSSASTSGGIRIDTIALALGAKRVHCANGWRSVHADHRDRRTRPESAGQSSGADEGLSFEHPGSSTKQLFVGVAPTQSDPVEPGNRDIAGVIVKGGQHAHQCQKRVRRTATEDAGVHGTIQRRDFDLQRRHRHASPPR